MDRTYFSVGHGMQFLTPLSCLNDRWDQMFADDMGLPGGQRIGTIDAQATKGLKIKHGYR